MGAAGIAGAAPAPWQVTEADPSGALAGAPRAFSSASTLGDGSRAVLFGGMTADGDPFADTWTFDGTRWERVCGDPSAGPADACGPDARVLPGLADTRSGAVLYGGTPTFGDDASNRPTGDEWAFDASTREWVPVCGSGLLPACAPGPRGMHAMAGQGGRIVLFGGMTLVDPDAGTYGIADDTWVSGDAGRTWSRTCGGGSPACGPGPRVGASMAWDGARFILFGGYVGGLDDGSPVADTWTFDGARWTPVCGTGALPACGPAARPFAGISGPGTFRGDEPRALLIGGVDPWGDGAGFFLDAWLWDGSTWTGQPTLWDDAPVPAATDPVVVVAGGVECRIVATGPTFGGPLGAQRTFVFDDGLGPCPTGTSTPAVPGTPAVPAASPSATPGAVAPAATAVPADRLAYTGRSQGWEAVAGAAAVALGAALVLATRRRHPHPA